MPQYAYYANQKYAHTYKNNHKHKHAQICRPKMHKYLFSKYE